MGVSVVCELQVGAASLYKNGKTGQYVLAFRGTEISNLSDSVTNFVQGVNLDSAAYGDAIELAENVIADLKKQGVDAGKLELVGHSLGGGLASAAAVGNGLKATVFNPAGLSKTTLSIAVDHYLNVSHLPLTDEQRTLCRSNAKSRITAFAVKYDALTSLQDKDLGGLLLPNTFGTVYRLNAGDAYGKLVDTVAVGGVKLLDLPIVRTIGLSTAGIDNHLMGAVMAGFGSIPK